MYDRFTDRARKVLQLANQEAQYWNHEYLGTEHILIGILKEGNGIANQILKNLAMEGERLIVQVRDRLTRSPVMTTMGKLPLTPRAKSVTDHALREARDLQHNYVGTEHLLLGLLREPEGIAGQMLISYGLSVEKAREEVQKILEAPRVVKKQEAGTVCNSVSQWKVVMTVDELPIPACMCTIETITPVGSKEPWLTFFRLAGRSGTAQLTDSQIGRILAILKEALAPQDPWAEERPMPIEPAASVEEAQPSTPETPDTDGKIKFREFF